MSETRRAPPTGTRTSGHTAPANPAECLQTPFHPVGRVWARSVAVMSWATGCILGGTIPGALALNFPGGPRDLTGRLSLPPRLLELGWLLRCQPNGRSASAPSWRPWLVLWPGPAGRSVFLLPWTAGRASADGPGSGSSELGHLAVQIHAGVMQVRQPRAQGWPLQARLRRTGARSLRRLVGAQTPGHLLAHLQRVGAWSLPWLVEAWIRGHLPAPWTAGRASA